MYEGRRNRRKRNKNNAVHIFRLICLTVISAAVGAVCMFLAMNVSVASEIVLPESSEQQEETVPVTTEPETIPEQTEVEHETIVNEDSSKVLYLTFDDGPSQESTSIILDILKERNIKATFFVVGKNVRKHPDVTRRIVSEGHTIGIHCNSHEYKEIYKSVDAYVQDFEEAYEAVKEVTGVDVELFRFPGGSINAYNKAVSDDIIKEMTSRGFIYYDWNASLEDALTKTEPSQMIANAKDTAMGRKKIVLLAHDIVYNTSQCLEDLIDEFPEYRMEALTPEVNPVQF